MKFALFDIDGHGMPLSFHLQEEGNDVWVGQVSRWEKLQMTHPETDDTRHKRLALYDGLFERKWDADRLLSFLIGQPRSSREDWFVFCDFNYLWSYADKLRAAGYRGLLPTRNDFELEKDRRKAKKLIKEKYPAVTLGEYKEFNKVADGLKFLKDNQDTLFVLKGFAEDASTVVPESDEPEINRALLEDALTREKKEYEREGFVLEEKIPDLVEFTPEAISAFGNIVGVTVDIEHKILGSRRGYLTGCTLDLVLWQDGNLDLFRKFLAPLSDMMLRENEITYWDLSILYSPETGEFYPGEFCMNRPGYNALFTELATAQNATAYVERLFNGEPLQQKDTEKIGVSARMFDLLGEARREQLLIADIADPNVWAWDVQKKNGKLYTTGLDRNTLIVTGAGETIEQGLDTLYETLDNVHYDSGYVIEKREWYDVQGHENILKRLKILTDKGIIK